MQRMKVKGITTTLGFGVLLSVAVVAGSQRPAPVAGRFDTADGLAVELFASEPMLVKPTNMAIDHLGRVWVVEGHNYRANFPDNQRKEGDRVVILEDIDGDGRADKQTVFYQGPDLGAPLGIAVLGNKVLVTNYENVFLFTNENDVPVSKEVFLRAQTTVHDHSTHAFVFGPDGKLYWNAGNAMTSILRPNGETVVDVYGRAVANNVNTFRQGMAFRLNEDGSEFEVIGHNFRNNFELAVDSFGSVWQTDNDDDGNASVRISYVMEGGNYGYQDELTGAGWRVPRYDFEETVPMRHWHQNSPGVVPVLLTTGTGSPAGLTVYEGALLPPQFRGQMIHAEPGSNIVRAYPAREVGAGYDISIENLAQNVENAWFRPSDIAVAPDGSLFIADWADPGVGGHRQGDQSLGRVYRVAPPGMAYRPGQPDLTTIEGQIAALLNPNQSVRYLAWHALHNQGARVEPQLSALFEDSNADPRHRARALWLLTKIDGRADYWVRRALADRNENIRIVALRAARQVVRDVTPYVAIVVHDSSAAVRREAAVVLRRSDSRAAAELWGELAVQHDGGDRWYLEALGIGAEGQWDTFFAAWRSKVGDRWDTPGGRDIVWRARAEAAVPMLVELITSTRTSSREKPRYFRSLDFHPPQVKQRVLRSLIAAEEMSTRADDIEGEIAALVLFGLDVDVENPDAATRAAIGRALGSSRGSRLYFDLIQRFKLEDRVPELIDLALSDPDGMVGREAVRVALNMLSPYPAGRNAVLPPPHPNANQIVRGLFAESLMSQSDDRVRRALTVLGVSDHVIARHMLQEVLLASTRSIEVRRETLRALGRTRGGENVILSALSAGQLPDVLHDSAAVILFSSYNSATREAAAKLLEPPAGIALGTRLNPGQLSLRSGSRDDGREVFRQVCTACHQVDGEGVAFGPDLSQIGRKLAKQALYAKLIDPSSGITFGYEGVTVTLRNGSAVTGYIESETASELRLKILGGVTQSMAVDNVVGREALGVSMMPPMAGALAEQQLVDLVEYLSSLGTIGRR